MPGRSAAPRGIDVSSHQQYPDWEQVAQAGYSFGFTKATGGAWYTNPALAYNWRSMKAVGLARGAYHYAFESSGQPLPGPGPEAEADFFCDTMAPLGIEPGDMVVLDIEEGPPGDLSDWVLRWLRRVETWLAFKPLVYTGRWFSDAHGFPQCAQLADYGLWLAAYQSTMPQPPAPWPVIAFWQYTDSAQVPGIAGGCDANLFNGSLDRLPLYGKPGGAPPAEEPPPEDAAAVAYNANYPASLQNDEWSCAPTSTDWAMRSLGRSPAPEWIEQDMLNLGYVTTAYGLMDHTGAGLVEWVELPDAAHYGADGFFGHNVCPVSFDAFAAEAAAEPRGPLLLGLPNWGGSGLGHWTGVRGYDASRQVLILANPATGQTYGQTELSREQFDARAGNNASLVAVLHPDLAAPEPEPTPPTDAGFAVGPGVAAKMAEHGDAPASDEVYVKGQGGRDAYSRAFGQSGACYVYVPALNRTLRFDPSA